MDLQRLSERFKIFAERECKGSSGLYEHLSRNIANDQTLLEMASHAREGQPVPNLLLGAVHYLLFKPIDHPLAQYYPSIVSDPLEPSSAFRFFKEFCERYEKEIIEILKNKLVQTNEVRRCAYLYPSFCYIYQLTGKPLALIEIGTSAGLQLFWDKYRYSYDTVELYGDKQSDLEITAEIRGDKSPPILEHSPPVSTRIGLDLHINDLEEPNDYLWLKALIWPEHKERLLSFEKSSLILKNNSLELIEGDGVTLLPQIVSKIPEDSTLCIFHTHVANQIPQEAKLLLMEQIEGIGQKRDVFHLYNNMWDLDLHLDYFIGGKEHKVTLAKTEGHGRWFQWVL